VKINQDILKIVGKRILITLLILFVIRVGTFLPVPGFNQIDLAIYLESHSFTRNLVSTFSGGDTFVLGLFTLNIFPYINATIFVQFLVGFVPELSQIQKEGGLAGQRYIVRLTRLITLFWAILQSIAVSFYLQNIVFEWSYPLGFEIVLWLTTGAMIVLWLSELITDYGLGNGSSILVYTNIISNLPNLREKILLENRHGQSLLAELLLLFTFLISIYGIVFLQDATRKIHLVSSKQLAQRSFKNSIKNQIYIPLRFNQAGVMPIILSTAILVVPNYIFQLEVFSNFNKINTNPVFGSLYWIVYVALILFFSRYYAILVMKPKDISEQLQKMAVTIPGIRPGIQTSFYLKQVISRVNLMGASLLAVLVVVPEWLQSTLKLPNINGLGITSLLIVAGVLLDLEREIGSIYYSNVYKNET
jgi:preprotein translocase subunit SecY